jgi:hypothetical protein
MGAINEVWEDRYYMVQMVDGTWCIVKGKPFLNAPIVKSDMTKEEAYKFMKLLKEN